eukprot:TRINITY_DN17456_c0_g1_i1.p1 TRINITY_DN17456_c0_g1~~TRINITY_DN17456_c0_g1_i1.p1  ORF type:complete len:104 (-),score=18.73 TRINITY_DN17456_c0_g1_i1:286-597(-)
MGKLERAKHGWIYAWRHLNCFFLSFPHSITSEHQIGGLNLIRWEDQKIVKTYLNNDTVPDEDDKWVELPVENDDILDVYQDTTTANTSSENSAEVLVAVSSTV